MIGLARLYLEYSCGYFDRHPGFQLHPLDRSVRSLSQACHAGPKL